MPDFEKSNQFTPTKNKRGVDEQAIKDEFKKYVGKELQNADKVWAQLTPEFKKHLQDMLTADPKPSPEKVAQNVKAHLNKPR